MCCECIQWTNTIDVIQIVTNASKEGESQLVVFPQVSNERMFVNVMKHALFDIIWVVVHDVCDMLDLKFGVYAMLRSASKKQYLIYVAYCSNQLIL